MRFRLQILVLAGVASCAASRSPSHVSVDDCSRLTVEMCSRRKCSAVEARMIDVDRHCLNELSPVGCAMAERNCDDAIVYAQDDQGQSWQFPNTCVVHGWRTFVSAEFDDFRSCTSARVRSIPEANDAGL